MNRGTKQGDNQEIEFVIDFNTNKNKYKDFIKLLCQDINNVWMCRVTTKQLSKLSNQRVFTRSDCYLIETNDGQFSRLLKNNSNYISEDILHNSNILYKCIDKSGISVKMSDSNKFQILKLQPDSFYKLFNNYELGAGASIYCKKENELVKNINVLEGWKTSIPKMITFFKELGLSSNFTNDLSKCKNIKTFLFISLCRGMRARVPAHLMQLTLPLPPKTVTPSL